MIKVLSPEDFGIKRAKYLEDSVDKITSRFNSNLSTLMVSCQPDAIEFSIRMENVSIHEWASEKILNQVEVYFHNAGWKTRLTFDPGKQVAGPNQELVYTLILTLNLVSMPNQGPYR